MEKKKEKRRGKDETEKEKLKYNVYVKDFVITYHEFFQNFSPLL